MYDSTQDTLTHIRRVQTLIGEACANLFFRATNHDVSKTQEPEKPIFDEMTPKLKGSTYGSEEYKGFLAHMKVALDHHYTVNSHHPEHYEMMKCPECGKFWNRWEVPEKHEIDGYLFCPECFPNGWPGIYESALIKAPGITGMSLLDILEMLCDWKAATERHADGDLARSIEISQQRFGYTDEMKSVLINTAQEMGFL